MEKQKNCEQCNILFNYQHNPEYPDKRKYCDKCGIEKKASWEARQVQPGQSGPAVTTDNKGIANETGTFQSTVWNHAVAANSYEVGKAGSRFKIYFESVEDLKTKITELKDAGLWDEYAMIDARVKE